MVKKLNNSQGFSLVELMIVVSIMAILALVAIPSYQGFQAKARQKEGFSLLIDYFTSASGTRAEFGIFPGNLKASGFHPIGRINYRLEVQNNVNSIDITVDDPTCESTEDACDCAGLCLGPPPYKSWQEAPAGAIGAIGPTPVAPSSCAAPVTNDADFRAQVSAVINNRADTPDIYEINETKTITMCEDGIK